VTEALSLTPWLIGVVTALVAFFALDLWRLIAEAQSRVGGHDCRMRLGAAGVVGAWVALALFATFVPGVRDSITSVPGLPAILLAALVGGVAALGFAPTFRRAFGAVPMESIMTLFYWRAIFGVWLLAGLAAGRLPAGFGLPAAVGDIAVTLLAIVILAGGRPPAVFRAGRSWPGTRSAFSISSALPFWRQPCCVRGPRNADCRAPISACSSSSSRYSLACICIFSPGCGAR